MRIPPPLCWLVQPDCLQEYTCRSRLSREYLSMVTNESGILFLRKVSVTIIMSMLRELRSCASRSVAFLLVLFVFFRDLTLKTAILGRGKDLLGISTEEEPCIGLMLLGEESLASDGGFTLLNEWC